MDDRKRPPVGLMLLPLVALGAMLAVQYFAPPKAQTEEQPTEQAAEQAPEAGSGGTALAGEPASAELSPRDSQSRVESQQLHQLENDLFIASFTDLNTAMVSLQVKGERYLDEQGKPFELVTTDKEAYLPLRPSFSGVTIPVDARWRAVEASKERLRFEWAGDGVSVTRTWELAEPPYQIHSTIEVRNDDPMQGRSGWASRLRTTYGVKKRKAVSSEGRRQC